MEKPIRIDAQRLRFVGAILMENYGEPFGFITSTAMTDYEFHTTADLSLTDNRGCERTFEVKTITSTWFDSRLNPYWNESWAKLPLGFQPEVGHRYWMLNAKDGDKDGKWHKLSGDTNAGLIYLMRDRLIVFNHNTLLKAFKGYGLYRCPHTSEFEDKRNTVVCLEHKAVIDLNEGHMIYCLPPKELFEKHNHNDFNRLNR